MPMKNMNLLIWLTQLGLSVAVPPVGFILLAFWLRDQFSWGSWVIWAGVILGIFSAVEGLRVSLKAMAMMEKKKQEEDPAVSFNEHL